MGEGVEVGVRVSWEMGQLDMERRDGRVRGGKEEWDWRGIMVDGPGGAWEWNGSGMGPEWKVEWKWNGNGMGVEWGWRESGGRRRRWSGGGGRAAGGRGVMMLGVEWEWNGSGMAVEREWNG